MLLIVAISKSGFRVSQDRAHELIYGYACGLDMTRRDLQPCDLIFAGTPEGVGAVVAGD